MTALELTNEGQIRVMPLSVIQELIHERNTLREERDEARKDVRKLQDIKQKHEHEELVAAQENDRLKIERDKARAALRFIAEWGGRTLESEYGNIDCNGKWCAEQAKEAAK